MTYAARNPLNDARRPGCNRAKRHIPKMVRTPLSLDGFIAESNQRLRHHPKYRPGMAVTKDPRTETLAGASGYTFTWPREENTIQAWFDARTAVFDIEMEMRERYSLDC